MSSPERRKPARNKPALITRAFGVVALAAALAGCFQPLYGQLSATGEGSVSEALSAVEVTPISAPNGTAEARLAVELRNALLFGITGGGGELAKTHRLDIQLTALRQQVIVDVTTARPDLETYGLNATYTLSDLRNPSRPAVTGQTFARVSYDIPGQEQRFARARGLRDAENRAAKQIADQIRSRLASYFVTGS